MTDMVNVSLSLDPDAMPDFNQIESCLKSARLAWNEGDRVRTSRTLGIVAFLAEQEGRRIFPYSEAER